MSAYFRDDDLPVASINDPDQRLLPGPDDTVDSIIDTWPNGTHQKHQIAENERAGFLMTAFNLGNDILGAGVVAVPYFIAQFGFWLSPVGFVLIGLVTSYTLSNMFSLGKKFRCDTYPEICERAWGTKGSLIASTFIFVYNWGNNVAGNLIVASSLPSMLRAFFSPHNVWISRDYVMMVSAIVFFPFCYFRNISTYAITAVISFFTLFGVVGVVIALTIVGPGARQHRPNFRRASIYGRGWLAAVCGIANMYVCHDLAVSVQSEMVRPTLRRWRGVVAVTLSSILVLWMAIGWAGYLRFGENVMDNVLEEFPDHNVLAVIARFLLCVGILIITPYNCFMPRVSLEALVAAIYPKYHKLAFHVIGTTVLCISSFYICLFIDDLGFVYELIGSVSALSLAYIIPPLLVCTLEPGPWYSSFKLLNIGIALLGVGFSVGGTYQIMQERFGF